MNLNSINIKIRKAEPREAELLSTLAYESKAFWGYPIDFMEKARKYLCVTEEEIFKEDVYVLEKNRKISGFYHCRFLDEESELVWLFIHPSEIGKGLGKKLWSHILELAKIRGVKYFFIHSDPNAEKFYLANGAVSMGTKSSKVDLIISMPWLRFTL